MENYQKYRPQWGRRLLLLLWVLAPLVSRAQVANYTVGQTVGSYVPITGGRVLALSNNANGPDADPLDGLVYRLPAGTIPFMFDFNGRSYDGFYVATNGFITFGAVPPFGRRDINPVTSGYWDTDHPLSATDGTGYEGAIAAVGAFLNGRVTPVAANKGEVRYQTLGAAPNRVFVLQWKNAYVFGDGGGSLNFQIRLTETSNAVELAYGPCTATRTNAVQVGLRGSDPGDFSTRTGPAWASSTAGATNAATLPLDPATGPPAGLRYVFAPAAPLPCAQPFSLLAPSRTATTATLTWRTLGSGAGPYQVLLGPAGFDPATATPRPAPGPSLAVSSLSPSTDYDFYVTQTCGGAAGTSPRSLRGSFRTTLPNDEPVDAIALPITATCQPVASTTAGATTTSSATAPGYNSTLPCTGVPVRNVVEVWFTFTTAASGPASTGVRLTATGEPAYRVRVFSSAGGAAGPFVPVFCANTPLYQQPFGPVIVAPLVPATTYYVAVSNFCCNAPTGPFTLCATEPPACSPPTSLQSIDVNSTTTTALVTFVPGSGATSYALSYVPVGGGVPVPVLPAPTGSPVTITGLAPATNYVLTLQANCPASNTQSTPQTVILRTRPVNMAPATAQALPPVGTACQPVSGSTLNTLSIVTSSPGLTLPPGAGCGTDTPYPVWYSFTTPASGPASLAVRVLTTGPAPVQVRVFAAPNLGGPFVQLACTAGAGTTAAPPLDVLGLSPSTTYYVLVADVGTGAFRPATFTLCVTAPPTCGTPLGVGVSSITTTGANLSFIGGTPPALSYVVTLTPQGGSPVSFPASGSSGQIPLTGLVPGTYYTLSLVASCGVGGMSLPVTITFRTLGPPANDLCANAQALTCEQTVPGFTAGATAAGDPPAGTLCGVLPTQGPGVWYRFVGTGDDVSFAVCPVPSNPAGSADARLHVFSGACGALTCVGAAIYNASCPGGLGYTLASVPGTVYYLLVSYASASDFELTTTCRPAGSCPPPTNVAVTVAPSGQSFSVSFTPAAGSQNFFTYGPANGIGTLRSVFTSASPQSFGTAAGQNYVLTMATRCANGSRSVGVVVPFSTVLATRQAALAAQVSCYPNPAHETLTLELPAALRGAVPTATLCNALGQAVRVFAVAAAGGPTPLAVADLPAGVYLLRLPFEGGEIHKRIVLN